MAFDVGYYVDFIRLSQIQTTLLILVAVISVIYLTKTVCASYGKRYPPGPWGFPIFGHLPLLGSQPHKTLHRFSKIYGDIYSIRMGSWPSVVITSKSLLREALVSQVCFSDRPPFPSMLLNHDYKSLAFGSYTKRWRQQRSIANHILRTSVNSNDGRFEDIVQSECKSIVRNFRDSKGKSFYPHDIIFQTVGGILYQLLYGEENKSSDFGNFKQYIFVSQKFVRIVGAGNSLDALPWTKYIFPKKVKQFQNIIQDGEFIRKQNVIDHLATFDPNNLRDVTDKFIAESMKLQEIGDDPLTKEQLRSCLDDIFGAGIDTASNTIQWFFLYMAEYPEIQKNIQREIKNVVGANRQPSLRDRAEMAYTQATILEVIRIVSVIPTGLPHFAMKDTTLNGFFIPKGTVLIYNAYGIMHDTDTWRDPEKFRPERFLTETNELDQQQADNIVAFGAGRRRCPGEFMAKMVLFLVVTNVLQNFEISRPSGVTYDFEGTFGLSYSSKPYEILVEDRND